MKKKMMQYDTKGHCLDFNMLRQRIPKMMRIDTIVVGGSIKLCEMAMS